MFEAKIDILPHRDYSMRLNILGCWQFDRGISTGCSIYLWQYTSSFPLTCRGWGGLPISHYVLTFSASFEETGLERTYLSPRSKRRLTWSMWPSMRLSRISDTNNCSTSFSGTLSSWWSRSNLVFSFFFRGRGEINTAFWNLHTQDIVQVVQGLVSSNDTALSKKLCKLV